MNKEYIPYGPEWEKEMSKFPKAQLIKRLGKALQQSPTRPSIDIVSVLKKIAKLSTYDTNHDNMLYNMRDINKLVKELLNQSK